MGIKDMLSDAWDSLEERFSDAKSSVRKALADARTELERRIDDAWESPTEKRQRREINDLTKELRSLGLRLAQAQRQRNVCVALLVAALSACAFALLL